MRCFDGIDNIFWDFDGTLCDSAADIRDSWRATFAELGLDVPHFDRVYRVGPPLSEAAPLLFPDLDEAAVARICDVYRRHYCTCGYPKSRPYPGVDALLEKFRAEGKKQFLATNKNAAPLEQLVGKFGWDGIFTELLNRDTLPPGETQKSCLLRQALDKYSLDPRRSAMVGDTPIDVAAGKAAGLVTIAATYGYGTREELESSRPDRWISREDLEKTL